MTINEIIEAVENVDNSTNYWFVRTDYGKFFKDFYEGNYIAIGWDYITLPEINNTIPELIKRKIATAENIDINTFGGKVITSTAYNKIKTFISLKKGDVVIIPSKNSDKLAFGKITDEYAYEDFSAGEFVKRRNVDWYTIKYMDSLNPIFYQVKSNQHTISNIKKYAPHIDRVIENLFRKGENTHYVLKIDKTEDINFDELTLFMENIKSLVRDINQSLNFDEDTNEFYIKINLQSKGSLELIKRGRSLAILAYLIFLTSCNQLDQEQDHQIQQLIQQNREILITTSTVIDSLEMNTQELIKPFNRHGN